MSNYRYHLVAGLLVLVDQITKLAVKGFSVFGFIHEGMKPGEVIPVLGDVLRFTFVENAGSAFGLDWGEGKIILTLATIVISSALFWYLRTLHGAGWPIQVAVMLLLAGAVGNLIDRSFYDVAFYNGALFMGSVVDFIQVDIPDMNVFGQYWTHFPVFNIADSCVSVGIVMMLLVGHRKSEPVAASHEEMVGAHASDGAVLGRTGSADDLSSQTVSDAESESQSSDSE